jgi:hypothetical protein
MSASPGCSFNTTSATYHRLQRIAILAQMTVLYNISRVADAAGFGPANPLPEIVMYKITGLTNAQRVHL